MAAAAPFLSIAGTVFSAISAIQQGNTAKKVANYNAAIAERNGRIAEQQAAADAQAKEREKLQRIGSIRAAAGASGVSAEGSPLDILSTNTALFELDKQNILYRGRLKALGFSDDAALERAKGSAAQTAGYFNAAGSLASGVGRGLALMDSPAPKPKKGA